MPHSKNSKSQRGKSAESFDGSLADDRTGYSVSYEPTRGIDVGAKAEIYKLITMLAAEGNARNGLIGTS
jgi:hypothetical protein